MPVDIQDFGDVVICDFCSEDWTGRAESGGLLFQSKAACPKCAPRIEADAKRYGEEHFIRERCPQDQSFATWVVSLAGGLPREQRIYTGAEAEERFGAMATTRPPSALNLTWVEAVPATMTGSAGEAWRVDVLDLEHRKPDTTATLGLWLLRVPGAHPLWSWWVASVIHLRPIPGVKPAVIRLAGASHEVIVAALDPREAVPDPRDFHRRPLAYLTPIDQCVQLSVPDDAAAVSLLEGTMRACCDGVLSPDQDFRSLWRRTIDATAAHARGEH